MIVKDSASSTLARIVDGRIVASVEIAVPPERVFKALSSSEVTSWWVRPGVFDTRAWTGDVRVGGRWRVTGMARGAPYALEGEYLEVDPPRRLVHTWRGAPEGPPSTVTYVLVPSSTGTLLTVYHDGVQSPTASEGITAGWDSSLRALAGRLSPPVEP